MAQVDAKNMAQTPQVQDSLQPRDNVELVRSFTMEEELKAPPEIRDYSGAHEKIDPVEIKLVRKLDLWIMPILWLMYWLNYLVRCLYVPCERC